MNIPDLNTANSAVPVFFEATPEEIERLKNQSVRFYPDYSDEARRRLGYHPVMNPQQQARYEENRERYMELFSYVEGYGRGSRELSLALTALQESLMWLNAHVACNDVDYYGTDTVVP